MDISNLKFFDKNGESLNLKYDSSNKTWTGSIYFDPFSVFLFDNENLFLLEKDGADYKFPKLNPGESIKFKWKTSENSNEFFIYDVINDVENDIPVIVKQESAEVKHSDIVPGSSLETIDVSAPLQLNISFNPSAEKVFTRTLEIYYFNDVSPNDETKIAEIDFYGEGLEEDERFGVWLRNFGIKFNREDANILKDYDIKETLPNWEQVNQARKDLLVNKEHIFPYVGTYKGLVNFVNILGFKDVLRVKEYWRNVNSDSDYFNKLFLVDISDKLDDGKIDSVDLLEDNKRLKFGKQFKKTQFLALVYQFTRESGEFDDDGIPIVEETTEFTTDEIFYKLNLLEDKLKNEFLPINVQIRDIIGEFIYFEKYNVKLWEDDTDITDLDLNTQVNINSFPKSGDFPIQDLNPLFKRVNENGLGLPLTTFNNTSINPYDVNQKYPFNQIDGFANAIEEFYASTKEQRTQDIGARYEWDNGDDPEDAIGTPVIFEANLPRIKWNELGGLTWQDLDNSYWTWENFDFKNILEIEWKITKPAPDPYSFTYRGPITKLHRLPHILPHVGEYKIQITTWDFYGNAQTTSTRYVVDGDLSPEILAYSRLRDNFGNTWKDLENLTWTDLGSSTHYDLDANVLDNDDFGNNTNPFKNVLEWNTFRHRFGIGKRMYDDVEFQVDGKWEDYFNTQHPFRKYWGLGEGDFRLRWSDLEGATWEDLFFMKWKDLIYTGDFLAGFYIIDPSPGDSIKMSGFDEFIIPEFNTLDELVKELNETRHPGFKLFNYEIIDGQIHAQANYFSKEMLHILDFDDIESPGSTLITKSDKYTFYHKDIYSDDLVEYFKKTYPAFDEETLFLVAPTEDTLNGDVQNTGYWEEKEFWKFDNNTQRGYLPTVFDENSFSLKNIKLWNNSFILPKFGTGFFVVNNLHGKQDYVWTLIDNDRNEEIVKLRGTPYFVWKFKETGNFTLQVEVTANNGATYTERIQNFIIIYDKRQYISNVKSRLNRRKNKLVQ